MKNKVLCAVAALVMVVSSTNRVLGSDIDPQVILDTAHVELVSQYVKACNGADGLLSREKISNYMAIVNPEKMEKFRPLGDCAFLERVRTDILPVCLEHTREFAERQNRRFAQLSSDMEWYKRYLGPNDLSVPSWGVLWVGSEEDKKHAFEQRAHLMDSFYNKGGREDFAFLSKELKETIDSASKLVDVPVGRNLLEKDERNGTFLTWLFHGFSWSRK